MRERLEIKIIREVKIKGNISKLLNVAIILDVLKSVIEK